MKVDVLPYLAEAAPVFKLAARQAKILSSLGWRRDVAEKFLQSGGTKLPEPEYSVDRQALQECRKALDALTPKLKGEHPALKWLRGVQQSFQLGVELLLSIEKPEFYAISSQLYGNAEAKIFNGTSTNLELARTILSRLDMTSLNDLGESEVRYPAEQFAQELERRLALRTPPLPVRVELSKDLVAKVAAGTSRVRIREDARFSELELVALWNHEIESHCLTAHNGLLQTHCDFLASGGARSTMTQEGLAVFFEIYGHTMSQRRFIALCHRVEAVAMAEAGADFIQVYRWFLERIGNETESFYNTQRIFRGASLRGGSAFTKDVVYLAGLLGVYNFLRLAVKHQNRLLVESLVCGRIALEDVATIAWLRQHGVIDPPRFVPAWLANWESLLSSFSLGAVLSNWDMNSFQNYLDDFSLLEHWDMSV